MNEFERLKELIKDNPGVPVVLKIKGMPEKNFDCRYYMTDGFIFDSKLMTEDEAQVNLFDYVRDDERFEDCDDYALNNMIADGLKLTESARIIAVEIW